MVVSPDKYVSLQNVLAARVRIDPIIRDTPLIRSAALSEIVGRDVWLKLDCQQMTGSFKLRGAANKMLQMTDEEKAKGVVSVSSGNHGRAVAYIAQRLGIRAVVCVADLVPENKREAIRGYGADLQIEGSTQVAAQQHAETLIEAEGLTWIPPYDDLDIITGQGTLVTDMLSEQPDIDTIIAPLSGGGLLSGVALAAKALSPNIEVVGISMKNEPGMVRCLEAGKLVDVDEPHSLADALGGSVGLANKYTYPIVRDFMDRYVLVSEESLPSALRLLFETEGLVTEGGSAVVISALLKADFLTPRNKSIGLVISGRNIAPDRFLKAIQSSEAAL